MSKIVDVRLRDFGNRLKAEEDNFALKPGERVIIKSNVGFDYAEVIGFSKPDVVDIREGASWVKITRKVNSIDLDQIKKNAGLSSDALKVCREKAYFFRLSMKLIASEYSFDRDKLFFYYTAPSRIDFRILVQELAGIFKTRIEMRQIGPRDESKMVGGIAPCGKTELCCTQFIRDFAPITTRMAKIQKLPVHQEKLLGLCGQLKCCLKYELETYEEILKEMPDYGTRISTKFGRGTIVDHFILRRCVGVELEDEKRIECRLDEISVLR